MLILFRALQHWGIIEAASGKRMVLLLGTPETALKDTIKLSKAA